MKKKSRIDERSGVSFVGFLMLGIAVGLFYNQVAAGTMAGLGLGFISMAFFAEKK